MLFLLRGPGIQAAVTVGRRPPAQVQAADVKAAVAEVCGWSEFEAYDLRKEYHDDGLGANLLMDLPLGVCLLYELRASGLVLVPAEVE